MIHKKITPSVDLPEGEQRRREFLGVASASHRRKWNQSIIQEAKLNCVSFGLPMLDRALEGAMNTELIAIGAAAGVGKSTIGLEIAKNVAMSKKRVLFVALEAEQNEIELKLHFGLFVSKWMYDPERNRKLLFDYRRYRFGHLDEELKKYAPEVNEIFDERYSTLETYYKLKDFTIESLRQLFVYAKDAGMHSIVVDHIHYFDLYGRASEKNEEMTRLMHDIRDLNLHYKIPVFLVAHVRKHNSVVPTLQDFHGTSEIGKIATTCIMLASRPNSYDSNTGCVDTIISVPKVRAGGKLNVVGLMSYHTQLGAYLPEYRVGSLDGDEVTELEKERLPYWAKHDSFCVNGKNQVDEPDPHY